MAKKKDIKKISRQDLIKEVDNVFSRFIRLRDANEKWIVTCPLCWAKMPRKQSQNMHFISRWNMKYRFNEKNCHAWCMRCNVYLNWNYIAYTRYMQRKYWISFVDRMIADKCAYKISTPDLVDMFHYYSNKANLLEAKLDISLIRK